MQEISQLDTFICDCLTGWQLAATLGSQVTIKAFYFNLNFILFTSLYCIIFWF